MVIEDSEHWRCPCFIIDEDEEMHYRITNWPYIDIVNRLLPRRYGYVTTSA